MTRSQTKRQALPRDDEPELSLHGGSTFPTIFFKSGWRTAGVGGWVGDGRIEEYVAG